MLYVYPAPYLCADVRNAVPLQLTALTCTVASRLILENFQHIDIPSYVMPTVEDFSFGCYRS